MSTDTEILRRPAPTLVAIITIKVFKGVVFLLLALGFYALSDNDLDWEYANLLRSLHIDGNRQFFLDLGAQIAQIQEATVRWVAFGTLLYASLSLVEAVGLMLRMSWAAILTAGESGLLIPVEVVELQRRFSITLLAVLIINIIIVWYLLKNRHRLFRHHLHTARANPALPSPGGEASSPRDDERSKPPPGKVSRGPGEP
jgi:uncharacterized membrane protein (DUF2068 family)